MKKILFINPGHFGSLTDTYSYYLNLKSVYEITYLGFDEGKEIPKFEGIRLIHLSGYGNSINQKILFLKKIVQLIRNEDFNFILMNYFKGSSVINLLTSGNIVIDIRSSYISSNYFIRKINNLILTIEVKLFKNITVISESLAKFLYLPKRSHVLPLGAPYFPLIKKDLKKMKMLYVGTFHERNIANTIYGFADFISKNGNKEIAEYTIIGQGSNHEIKNIQNAINSTGIKNKIFFKGTIRYPELNTYLLENNVGLSYIPIRKHFENQPPTKTFEYLLSGMVVLATGTKENKKVITNNNGLVIGDEIIDVSNGLQQIYNNRFMYNSEEIQMKAQKYSWENIISENLIPYIESI